MDINLQNQPFTVGSVGVSANDSVLLKALINLTPGTRGYKWTYVGSSAAAVVIVDIDSPEGVDYLGSHPKDPLIVLAQSYDGSYPFLSKPVRNSNLRELMEGFTRQLQRPAAAPQPAAAPTRAAAPSAQERLEALKARQSAQTQVQKTQAKPVPPGLGSSLHFLLERLEKGNARHTTLFTLDSISLFAIDPESGLGFVNGGLNSLLVLKEMKPQDIDSERITPRRLTQFRERSEAVPLDRLRWFGGVNFSGGQLLRSISGWSAFKLRRWPDFGRLPYKREFARMARLLMTRAASVEQLALRGGMSERDVVGFLNSAFLCGWLERAAAAAKGPIKPPLTPSPRAGLISKLRTSLGM